MSVKNIYEINTAPYLNRLSREYQQPISLATIPDQELTRIANFGCDAVWLMGIWERSPLAREIALSDEAQMAEIRAALPDFTPEDVLGSAYAVHAYTIHEAFGGETELAVLRERLAQAGLRLILDFVPNHTALDHKWTIEHPEYYIQGSVDDTAAHPTWYQDVQGIAIAKGRDPYFEPWPDVAQLNAFSPDYRQASIATLRYIASLCDGVRCDMAMLMTNDIFAKTWGARAGATLTHEYWQEVITAVRDTVPDFLFIAECYWNMQAALIEQGFDYCYDKATYDAIVANNLPAAKALSDQTGSLAPHFLHFLENHDEPRAASLLNAEKQRQAIRFLRSLPGPRLWHDGQFDGLRVKLPVHIGRSPAEPANDAIAQMYRQELQR